MKYQKNCYQWFKQVVYKRNWRNGIPNKLNLIVDVYEEEFKSKTQNKNSALNSCFHKN